MEQLSVKFIVKVTIKRWLSELKVNRRVGMEYNEIDYYTFKKLEEAERFISETLEDHKKVIGGRLGEIVKIELDKKIKLNKINL